MKSCWSGAACTVWGCLERRESRRPASYITCSNAGSSGCLFSRRTPTAQPSSAWRRRRSRRMDPVAVSIIPGSIEADLSIRATLEHETAQGDQIPGSSVKMGKLKIVGGRSTVAPRFKEAPAEERQHESTMTRRPQFRNLFEGRLARSSEPNPLITRNRLAGRDSETLGHGGYRIGQQESMLRRRGAPIRDPAALRPVTKSLAFLAMETRTPRRLGLGVCVNPRVGRFRNDPSTSGGRI